MVDITGKKDATFVKDKYQKVLDHSHKKVKDKVKWLYKMNRKLKDFLGDVQKYKNDLIADEDERRESYSALQNLLSSEKDFEKEMMTLSKKGSGNRNVTIKPKFKDSDIDDLRINAMQEYLDKYPEYASKSTIKKILDKISEIESGIKRTKKTYNTAVSNVLKELAYFPRNLMEAENLVKKFNNLLEEAKEKTQNMRYVRSPLYKIASEKEKTKVTIETLYYKMDEFEATINKIKEETISVKKQNLEELEF